MPFVTFIAAALVVLLTPGPGVLYVVTRTLHQGRRAGLVSVLGLSAGALVHVFAATVGLSAMLLASATAFRAVKICGASYLVYLGILALRRAPAPVFAIDAMQRSLTRQFVDGMVVSLLNPKIAMFFLAFLPQFVRPGAGPLAMQILLLGSIYVALAICTDGLYALLADRLRDRFVATAANARWPGVTTGAVYIGLGCGTALAERP